MHQSWLPAVNFQLCSCLHASKSRVIVQAWCADTHGSTHSTIIQRHNHLCLAYSTPMQDAGSTYAKLDPGSTPHTPLQVPTPTGAQSTNHCVNKTHPPNTPQHAHPIPT
jgi:hypothetical protein